MRHPPVAIVALLPLLLPFGVLRAQEEPVAVRPPAPVLPDTTFIPDSAGAAPRSAGCWRARPSPPCKVFLLTDFGVEVPLRSTSQPDAASAAGRYHDFRTRISWMLGVMGTRGRHSYGGAVSLSADEGRYGGVARVFELRYRRWMNHSLALDAGAGIKASDVFEPGVGVVRGRGPTAMVGFTPNHWVGISARAELVRARGRNHGALLAGIQSTRLSEVLLIQSARLLGRLLLDRLGFPTGDEEE